MRIYVNCALRSGAALACLLVPGAAYAQSAGGGRTIETVVVTAERRDQNAQEVPIAMSAIGGDELDKQGIKSLIGLGQRVPSLRFGDGVTGGENQIVVRGLSNQNVTPFGEGSVSYNTDGIYMGRSTSIDPEFFDIDRIEVLRGPQGTLFGRNSVGGSINVVTNKPTDELSGHVDALIGDYNARIFRGWANVPLYECGDCKILARITGVSANHDPYQKNVSQAPTATQGADRQDYQMIRGQLLVQFNADVDLLLSATTTKSDSPVGVKYRWDQLTPPYNSRYAGEPYYNDPRVISNDFPLTADSYLNFFAATLNWNLDWAKFTSVTSVSRGHWEQTADGDGSNLNIAITPFWGSTSTQQSQEFRLASNNDASPLKWIGGVFLYREYADQTFLFQDTGLNNFAVAYAYFSPQYLVTRSYAVFGQADYDLGKTSAEIPLTVTLGLRYTHDNKFGHSDSTYQVTPFGITLPLPTDFNSNWAQITGKFGLSYKVSDDVMLFASASKGYQAGGRLVVTYAPQQVWSYEAGIKSQWLGNTLQLNANVFRQDITNMQIFIQNATGTRMENAGKAHVNGLELEFLAVPVDGLKINAEVSLMDAKYDSYMAFDSRDAGIYPPGMAPLLNNAGNRLNYVPKYTVNFGAEYAIETSAGTFTPRFDVFTSGDVYFSGPNTPLDRQAAYTFVNLNLSYVEPQGRWMVDAFVRNVFDRDVLSNQTLGSASLGNGIQPNQQTYYPPRTVGVRFGANF